jgi:predicted small lipoprotein YifL
MTRTPVALILSALLLFSLAACGPMRPTEGPGASPDSSHQRHNGWARFGRPDVGGARANDR